MEQLTLVMELKDQYDKLGSDNDDSDDNIEDDCQLCESYEEENQLLREQTD